MTRTIRGEASVRACLALDGACRLAEIDPTTAIDVIQAARHDEIKSYYGSDNWRRDGAPVDKERDRLEFAVAAGSQQLLLPFDAIFAEARYLQSLSFGG